MAKLTMGTDNALALQHTIQIELARRGYSSETDPVMAEYITIMVINDKTPDQINSELADLIGPDYESNFTDWLFTEAAKAAAPPTPLPSASLPPSDTNRGDARPAGPGASLIQNALSAVHPPTAPSANRSNASQPSSTAQKRSFSARSPSPSPSQPPKARRTDAPIGPRAMMDRERGTLLDRPLQAGSGHQNGRSLLERVGPHNRRGNHNNSLSPAQVSHIQAKIDGITGNPRHHMNGRAPSHMPPVNAGPAINPLAMQEMIAMQMNLMTQMAANMGMMNTVGPGFGGFPQQNTGGFPQQQQQQQNGGLAPANGGPAFSQQRGRGVIPRGGQGRGGGMGGVGRGRGGSPTQFAVAPESQPFPQPQPQPPQQQSLATAPVTQPASSVPERPGTPSLCKYALKCTNLQCRFSHPSPVATAESGVVLSTEFCSKGRDCKDKHCTLGHVSPSIVNGSAQKLTQTHVPAPAPAPAPVSNAGTPCKFGLACTRPGCMFTHPPNFRPPHAHHPSHHHVTTSVPCRFGASCTRGDCPFQHPKGHVSANMFYRGLGPDAPLVEGYVSPHRSVRFGPSADVKAGEEKEQVTQKKDEKESKVVALGNDKVGEKKTVDVGA